MVSIYIGFAIFTILYIYIKIHIIESLRLSSLIPQYTKVCTLPTVIKLSESKSLDVEVGMTIMIPNYQFHHDKQYFPEPEAFKPERFDNGAYQELMRKGIFLPFSDGPRICMGESLKYKYMFMNFHLCPYRCSIGHADSEIGSGPHP